MPTFDVESEEKIEEDCKKLEPVRIPTVERKENVFYLNYEWY